MKELLVLGRRSFHQDYWALKDVSFEVLRGETFCIIGENGCGKSTLLQICAGIMQPSAGTVNVTGRIAALLELGSGFNPEFSGRENVYLNGAILGFSVREMDRLFPDIAAFAEIGDFMDQPVKTYSSGMAVRLGFSVAIHVYPEVLLVDEALAVGDIYFRQRCLRKIHELRSQGVTILFVSHAMNEVKQLGDRAMWLDHGRIMAIGSTDIVASKYLAAMSAKDANYKVRDALDHPPIGVSQPDEIELTLPNVDRRSGNQMGEVLGIAVYDHSGEPVTLLKSDSSVTVRVSVKAHTHIAQPIVGVLFRNQMGVELAGVNTTNDGTPLGPLAPGETRTVDFYIDFPTIFTTSMSFSPAIANGSLDEYTICDFVENALVLEMLHPEGQLYGPLRFPCRIAVNSRLGAGAPAT